MGSSHLCHFFGFELLFFAISDPIGNKPEIWLSWVYPGSITPNVFLNCPSHNSSLILSFVSVMYNSIVYCDNCCLNYVNVLMYGLWNWIKSINQSINFPETLQLQGVIARAPTIGLRLLDPTNFTHLFVLIRCQEHSPKPLENPETLQLQGGFAPRTPSKAPPLDLKISFTIFVLIMHQEHYPKSLQKPSRAPQMLRPWTPTNFIHLFALIRSQEHSSKPLENPETLQLQGGFAP